MVLMYEIMGIKGELDCGGVGLWFGEWYVIRFFWKGRLLILMFVVEDFSDGGGFCSFFIFC